MKNKLLWIGSVVILVISVFTFIVFGVGTEVYTALFGKKLPPFGSYNGHPIKYEQGTEFSNYVAQYVENEKQQNGSLNNFVYYRAFSQAFNTTVENMFIENAVKESGYIVPETEEDRAMVQNFSDANGYSQKLYNQTSDEQKKELREQISKELLRYRYSRDTFGIGETLGDEKLYGLKINDSEKDFYTQMGKEVRKFNMAVFNKENFPKKEAIKFALEHKDLFTKYNLSVLSFSTKEDAESALQQLKAGEITFDAALTLKTAKNFYRDNSGKLINNYDYQISNIVKPTDDDTAKNNIAAIKALAKDAYSDVIEMRNGFSIFRGDGEAEKANFDAAIAEANESEKDSSETESANSIPMNDIMSYMKSYEATYIDDYYTNLAKDFSSSASNDFINACAEYGIENVDLPAFPLNYGNSSLYTNLPSEAAFTSPYANMNIASTNENFLKTIFALKEGEISAPIVLGNNVLVLQFVQAQNNDETIDSIDTEVLNYDLQATVTKILDSPKIVNNVEKVLSENFFSDNN